MDNQPTGVELNKYATTEEIKAFRVEVDVLIQKAMKIVLDCHTNSDGNYTIGNIARNELNVHLIESKMWLGKCLEAMGNPFPKELADKAPLA